MFEKASRKKLRFDTVKGQSSVTVEDLWDMPLTRADDFSLDGIYKSLKRSLKENEEESYVVKASPVNETLELKLEIVKHVIDVKLSEQEERENASLKKAQKEKLLSILAEKKDEDLKGKSIKELEKMINAL